MLDSLETVLLHFRHADLPQVIHALQTLPAASPEETYLRSQKLEELIPIAILRLFTTAEQPIEVEFQPTLVEPSLTPTPASPHLPPSLKDPLILNSKIIETLHELLRAVLGCVGASLTASPAIGLIELYLDMLGMEDWKVILPTLLQYVHRLTGLSDAEQHRLLRVFNLLLRRITRADDSLLRGELHLAVCQILPYLHDSGFQTKVLPMPTEALPEDDLPPSDLPIEFYHDFWEMHGFLSQASEYLEGPSRKQLPARLGKAARTLQETVKYFRMNDPHDYGVNPPVKFMKNRGLFVLQLASSHFRGVLMIQAMIAANAIAHSKVALSEGERQDCLLVESLAVECLTAMKSEVKANVVELIKNDTVWADTKERWKDLKKNFFRTEEEAPANTLAALREEVQREQKEKMRIRSQNFEAFLDEKEVTLTEKPTTTSFALFYEEAKECLLTFDEARNTQTFFENRSRYNIFEWRALRCLYRESLADKLVKETHPKFPNYPLLSFIAKKKDEFEAREASSKV